MLNSVPDDDIVVLETFEELEFAIRAENEGGKATWIECFSNRNMLWKRTMNGMVLQLLQQLNGQNFYCELDFSKVISTTDVIVSLLWRHIFQECRNCVSSVCSPCTALIYKWARLNPFVIQTILGAVAVIGTIPALYLIETWGRRKVRYFLNSSSIG